MGSTFLSIRTSSLRASSRANRSGMDSVSRDRVELRQIGAKAALEILDARLDVGAVQSAMHHAA
jgi:hypothetical protein